MAGSCESADSSEEEDGAAESAAVYSDCEDLGFSDRAPGASAYALSFQPKAQRRLRRFEAKRKAVTATQGGWTDVPKSTLKGLLRKGVPPKHRSEVWWDVLGCDHRRQQNKDAYRGCLDSELPQKTADEIDRDLHRIFPGHCAFQSKAGRERLRHVLHAYANYSPQVSYCQGLNYIVGILLLVFGDEERAFWAFVCAVDVLGVESYYTEGMVLLRSDMRVLTDFLQRKCPRVWRQLQEQNVELMSICSEWHITWFAKSLPPSTTLRVWDTLFFEGYKVLFRVSLGVFKCAEQEVMQCDSFETLMERSKLWLTHLVQHNELIKASFAGIPRFRRSDLQRARDAAMVLVEKEDAAQRQRLRAYKATQ